MAASDRPGPAVSVDELVREAAAELALSVRAGQAGMARVITVPRIQKPSS